LVVFGIANRSYLCFTYKNGKKILLPAILCFFFGVFGAHRFYVGKYGTAIVQLLTIGGLGVWAMIDFLIIVFGAFTDAEGNKIKEWK